MVQKVTVTWTGDNNGCGILCVESRRILETESTVLAKLDVGVNGMGRLKDDSHVNWHFV